MGLNDFLTGIIQSILKLFPQSPFKAYIGSLASWQGLGWLNWFIPVSDILAVCSVWLVAIGAYYLFSTIGRWLHIIS
jgi:hypothetical protein